MLKTIQKILFLTNLVLGLCLGLAYFSPIVSPELFWPAAFFGLAYPFLLIANILFCIYWVILFNIRFLFSLVLIGIGYLHIPKFIQFNSAEEVNKEEALKTMSFNVRLFDLYNWKNNKDTRNEILDYLVDEAPEIICFQEFYYSGKKGYFETLDTLLKIQKARYYHSELSEPIHKIHQFGMVTFSAYPIIKTGKITFEGSKYNLCMWSDILYKSDTIRVYNAHLASVHFKKKDYEVLEANETNIDKEKTKQLFSMLSRLKVAFQKRAAQAELMVEHIKNSPHPVLVCGDFNDTPLSYAYQSLVNVGLCDAFPEKGNGLGITYNGSVPAFRIDYMLHDSNWETLQFDTDRKNFSDHFPVKSYFRLTKNHNGKTKK